MITCTYKECKSVKEMNVRCNNVEALHLKLDRNRRGASHRKYEKKVEKIMYFAQSPGLDI